MIIFPRRHRKVGAMARFTELEFLTSIFHPKKSTPLTGLRKRTRVGKQWNNRRRLAFNKMSAKNQEILRRSGKEEDYLKGEATLKDAKDILRITAVKEGIAKAPKQKTVQPKPTIPTKQEIGMHILELVMQRPYNKKSSPIDVGRISDHAGFILQRGLYGPIMQAKTYDDYLALIRSKTRFQYQYDDDDSMFYLWYH